MGLDKKYTYERNGKTIVLYAGLLDLAHEQSGGYLHLHTQLVQAPSPENGYVAICFAEAKMATEHGVVYRSATGLGDADPNNCGAIAKNALIRMAETRSKARALRDLTNVAAAVDETDEGDDRREPDGGDIAPSVQRVQAPPRQAANGDGHAPITISLNPAAPMTRAQGTRINELRERAGEPALTPVEAHAAGMTVSRAADEIERLTQKVAAVRN